MAEKWAAWVWIKWKPQTPSNAWESWQQNKSILGAFSTMGEWDSVLWVDASTPQELEDFVWKTIRKNEWVAATNTTWAKKWW
jgi:hypothetical protein